VADICFSVGLQSVGSFTTSFTRTYGMSPTAYRASFPPASRDARIPACMLRAYARPQRRTFREDNAASRRKDGDDSVDLGGLDVQDLHSAGLGA
jgi:hypothetical protein